MMSPKRTVAEVDMPGSGNGCWRAMCARGLDLAREWFNPELSGSGLCIRADRNGRHHSSNQLAKATVERRIKQGTVHK